jgi:hypothetical protein
VPDNFLFIWPIACPTGMAPIAGGHRILGGDEGRADKIQQLEVAYSGPRDAGSWEWAFHNNGDSDVEIGFNLTCVPADTVRVEPVSG